MHVPLLDQPWGTLSSRTLSREVRPDVSGLLCQPGIVPNRDVAARFFNKAGGTANRTGAAPAATRVPGGCRRFGLGFVRNLPFRERPFSLELSLLPLRPQPG